MTNKKTTADVLVAIKALINNGNVGTQQEICEYLIQQGYEVNQSKISRLMRGLRTIKVINKDGNTVYSLPKEPQPPPTSSALTHLVLNITANESLVVVRTSPGSAALIARLLDYQSADSAILGTLAGDDTIFIAPKSTRQMETTLLEVKQLLAQVNNK